MIPIALTITAILAVYGFVQYRRFKRFDYIARAEEACGEFGRIRHAAVLAFTRGEIGDDDLKAFLAVHEICTQVLHISAFFREFTTRVCLHIANDSSPAHAYGARGLPVSRITEPLVQRVVRALDSLIQQFSHPILIAVCAPTGLSVLQNMLQIRARRREIEARRRNLEMLRNDAALALS